MTEMKSVEADAVTWDITVDGGLTIHAAASEGPAAVTVEVNPPAMEKILDRLAEAHPLMLRRALADTELGYPAGEPLE